MQFGKHSQKEEPPAKKKEEAIPEETNVQAQPRGKPTITPPPAPFDYPPRTPAHAGSVFV